MNAATADVLIDPARRLVRVRCKTLGNGSDRDRAQFLGRVMGCPRVERVEIDARRSTAEIHLAPSDLPFERGVAELAAAVRGRAGAVLPVSLPGDCLDADTVSVQRFGDRLTTWQVGSDGPRRLRFRHPRMRRDRVLARSVERLVVALPGVRDARLSGFSSDLVLRFDGNPHEADTLLAVLQHVVERRSAMPAGVSPLAMLGTSTTLTVAALTDFVMPMLAPVSATMLVVTNLGTMGTAVADLQRRRIGMPTIATAIILGTLATGQFLASGIMAWSLDFWRRRHRRDIEAERRLLLDEVVPLPACTVIDAEGGPATVQPLESIRRGDQFRLEPWDVVPADGAVIEGGGVIDDRCASGVSGARAIAAGDLLPAGAILLGGRVVVAVERPASETRVSAIGRLVATATESQPGRLAPTAQAEAFVEQFAAPTLATAGLGLLAGDMMTAVAVMRPDYASAEAMTVSFEDLDAVATALSSGCVLASPRALDMLDAVDTVLLVDHPGLRLGLHEVVRITAAVEPRSAAESELLRWGASLARHLADPRREALAAVAGSRGCVLADIVPESFGDERGIRIVHRQTGRVLVLAEAAAEGTELRPLVLEIDGTPRVTFEFGLSPARRAGRGVARIKEVKPLRLLLATAAGDATADTLAAELGCDEQIELPDLADRTVAHQVAKLRMEGRRVAVIGAAASVSGSRAAGAVTLAMGLTGPAETLVADVVSLSGDIACVADLLLAASRRRERMALSRKLTILPNMACVVGAFFFGFTSLVAAVVTNVGTLGIYRRGSSMLQRTRRTQWLRHRATVPRVDFPRPAGPSRTGQPSEGGDGRPERGGQPWPTS